MKHILHTLVFGSLLGSLEAKLVSQEFTGTLQNNAGVSAAFAGEFPAGTRWTVLVEWDDAQTPAGLTETQSSWVATQFTLTFEGKSGPWTSSAKSGGTFTLNEYATVDEIQFTSGWGPEVHTNPALADYPLYSFNLIFTHSQGEAFDGVEQVPSVINLDDWMLSLSELKIYVNNEAFPVIKGSIDSVDPSVTSTGKASKVGVVVSGEKLKDGKSMLDLGSAEVNARANTKKIRIKNTGTAVLKGLKFDLSGKARKDFRVVGSVDKLAPGKSATFRVVFQPERMGLREATLEIRSNDPKSPFDVELVGLGAKL